MSRCCRPVLLLPAPGAAVTTAVVATARLEGMSFADARVSVACDLLVACIEAEVTGREGGCLRSLNPHSDHEIASAASACIATDAMFASQYDGTAGSTVDGLSVSIADVPSLWDLWRGAAEGAHAVGEMADAYQAWRRATGVAAVPAGHAGTSEVSHHATSVTAAQTKIAAGWLSDCQS